MKPLDYEKLWNSFRENERLEITRCAMQDRISADTLMNLPKKQWAQLTPEQRASLLRADWEFALGRRY